MIKNLLPLLLLSLFTASCQNQKTKNDVQQKAIDTLPRTNILDTSDEDFISFWQAFRKAVINNDTTKIIELTHLPFKTRGPLDDDPVIEYNKKQFIYAFNAYLSQWSGEDLNGTTELYDIKKAEIPKKTDVHGDEARVGDLVFNRSEKKWRLVFAYLDNETIDSLKKISTPK